MSVILNAQIKQMLRDRKVILSTELEPTPYLVKIMDQVEKDISTKKNSISVESPEKLLTHLASL